MTMIAIFPGTFDPITLGHQDLIARAANVFSKVIVAVAENAVKNPVFTFSQRVTMAKNAMQNNKNVQVLGFSNLLIDFSKEHNANVIIRGVRIAADFEYELQLANMNRSLSKNIETIFFTPTEQYAYISSTLVKEIANLGGDVSSFVNPDVVNALQDL